MSDAEKFQEAIQLLAAAVRDVLESGEVTGTDVGEVLQEAYDRYSYVVVELHGSDDE